MTEQKPLAASQLAVSERQASLIKSVFKGNEDLLIAMRSLFFGLKMTDSQKATIVSNFAGKKEIIDVVRKKMYPLFEEDIIDLPIGLVADFWLDIDKELLGASPDTIYQRISSKETVLGMLTKAMALLENPEGEQIVLKKSLLESDPFQVSLLARSLYIRTVSQGLYVLKLISDMEEETPEQKKKKALQNSTK